MVSKLGWQTDCAIFVTIGHVDETISHVDETIGHVDETIGHVDETIGHVDETIVYTPSCTLQLLNFPSRRMKGQKE